MEHRTLSLQESATGYLERFLQSEGCECLRSIKLLAYLTGAIHRYEEEGVALDPQIVFCSSIDDVTSLLPGGKAIIIGEASLADDAGKRILKDCATLARSGWAIFVEKLAETESLRYGLLSFLQSPTSVELSDVVRLGLPSEHGQSGFALVARREDEKTVLLTGARGNSLTISFSTTRVVSSDTSAVDRFSDLCTSEIKDVQFGTYFRKILGRTLANSHGTILVCRSGAPISEIPAMTDAVILDPPLDLAQAFADYDANRSAESMLELQRAEALVGGMFASDGIVVFDKFGRISAYRTFYRPENGSVQTNATGNMPNKTVGGARRRAFEGLRSIVGEELDGILFRSQDGLTEFHGKVKA